MLVDTSWVRFRLDINNVNKIMKLLLNTEDRKFTKKEIANEINLPEPKTEAYLYWGRYLGLINPSGYQLTNFGKIYKELWKLEKNTILEILYYKCIKNNLMFNYLVNDFLFEKFNNYPKVFNANDLDNYFKDKLDKLKLSNLDSFKSNRSIYISSISEEEGFGRLGIISKDEKQKYNISKYLPSWKGALYILNQIAFELKNKGLGLVIKEDALVNERNYIGRIFMLNRDDVSFLLDELLSKNFIRRERAAGFNQIFIRNKSENEEDLLGALIRYE